MKTSARPQQEPAVAVALIEPERGGSQATVSIPPFGVPLAAVERALIAFAVSHAQGNRTRAARFLRLTRSALLYRMHKYGLAARSGTAPAPSRDNASH